MPLHKRTVSGDVTETLTYTVETADAFGAQIVDVRFYDAQGEQVSATGGSYTAEWSANGRDWMNVAVSLADAPVKDWQAGGYVKALRVVPTSITGAVTWSADFRFHGIGNSQIASSEDLAFDNGASFRVDYPFSIPQNGDPIVLKYSVTAPTILTLSTVEIDQGGVIYKVYTEAQTTETSAFTQAVPVYPKNTIVTPQVSPVEVFGGGSATFTGQQNTTLRVRTSSSNSNRVSAVSGESTRRGFGVTTVYVEIDTLAEINSDSQGVLKQEFHRI